jgi:hypothetical protein
MRTYCAVVGTGLGKGRAKQGGKWRKGRASAHLLHSRGEQVHTYCAAGTGRGEQVRTYCAPMHNIYGANRLSLLYFISASRPRINKCVLMAISAHLWGSGEAGIRTNGLADSRGIYRRYS